MIAKILIIILGAISSILLLIFDKQKERITHIIICLICFIALFKIIDIFQECKTKQQSNNQLRDIYNILKTDPYLSTALIDDPSQPIKISKKELDYYKKLDKEITPLKLAIPKINENNFRKADIYFHIGNLKTTLNEYGEAIQEYKKAISLDSANSNYFNNLAIAQKSINDIKNAEENFKKAIDLAPQNPIYYRNLARSLILSGQYKNALSYINKAYTLEPNDIDSINMLGVVYSENKDYDKAEEWFGKALVIFPEKPSTYYNLGMLNKKKNELIQAEDNFKQAIDKDNTHILAYIALANLYKETGKKKEALEYFERGSKIEPQINSDLLYNYGVFLHEEGKEIEAIDKFKQACLINPYDVEALNNWGVALKKTGKLEESIEKFQKAISIDPNNAKFYYNLGNAFGMINDKEKTIDNYTIFLKLSNGKFPKGEKNAKKYLEKVQGNNS